MKFDGKAKSISGIAAGVLVVAIVMVEFFMLRGDTIYTTNAKLGESVTFTVAKQGEPHLIEVSDTRSKKRRGAYTLKLTLTAPDGEVTISYDESIPREKTRYIEFTPVVSGDYTIKLEGRGLTKNPRLRIKVLVNDKRLTRRLSF